MDDPVAWFLSGLFVILCFAIYHGIRWLDGWLSRDPDEK